jgi:hypothetical protein
MCERQHPAPWLIRCRIGLIVAGILALAACSGVPNDGGKIASNSGSRGIRTKLDGWGPTSPPAGFPRFVDHSVGQEEISMQAMGLVGIPYRWGGNTPSSGFDCSGLVRYVVERAADVNLPRTTADMSHEGVSIRPDEVAPGDLIFFNTDGRAHSHVGVYVGNYRFVDAPSTGGTVRIDYVTNPYWAKHFDGIRRVAGRSVAPTPAPLRDVPITPITPPPSIMPPRAYASTTPALVPAAPNDPGYASASAPTDIPTSSPSASTNLPDTRATIRTAQAISTTSPDPIAATIARETGAEIDDPIARIGARGY